MWDDIIRDAWIASQPVQTHPGDLGWGPVGRQLLYDDTAGEDAPSLTSGGKGRHNSSRTSRRIVGIATGNLNEQEI